ncbi:MAG: hypothetical protein FJ091_17410 [Deltaproteobacteria bacterium]|nr:hypothetical protein [Deltaproteobacteria bacterium]
MSGFALSAMARDGAGWIGSWSPGIGDPTAAGWLATLGYFAAAWSCYGAAQRIGPALLSAQMLRRESRIWQMLAALLAALGVNKQLDLQSALTELGRIAARSGGWYGERRGVQFVFIACIALAGAAAAIAALWTARRTSPPVRLAVAGALAILAFVVVRAASFHHFDIATSREVLGLRVGSLVELAGIAVVLTTAGWRQRQLRG